MRPSLPALAVAAAVLVMFGVTAASAGESNKLTQKDVPTPVLTAFAKAYPKAVINGFEREKRDGEVLYEIESSEGGVERNVLFKADGSLVEVEESIPVASLPEVVRKGIHAAHPKGEIEKAEKITRGNTVEYEVLVKQDQAAYELTLSSDGKVLRTEKVTAKEDDRDTEKDDD